MPGQWSRISAYCNGIIARFNITVFDFDVIAAVNVKSVIVKDLMITANSYPGHLNIFAAMEQTVPIGGILKTGVMDPNVFAFAEKQHL